MDPPLITCISIFCWLHKMKWLRLQGYWPFCARNPPAIDEWSLCGMLVFTHFYAKSAIWSQWRVLWLVLSPFLRTHILSMYIYIYIYIYISIINSPGIYYDVSFAFLCGEMNKGVSTLESQTHSYAVFSTSTQGQVTLFDYTKLSIGIHILITFMCTVPNQYITKQKFA